MSPNTEQLEALEVDFDRWWNRKAKQGVRRACPFVTEADSKWIAWIAWLSCHEKITKRRDQ
jgi:hypothetical protein